MVQQVWKTEWQFHRKLNILSYKPAVVSPGIYPNELKIYVHVNLCTQMYITALFLIAKIWKQPRCPSVNVNNQLTNIC